MINWLEFGCSQKVDVNGEIIEVATVHGLECIVQIILNLAIRLAGITVFVMFLIGGFKYLTAGGDPKATQSAKNTLTYAIAGLVLIILSWFILRLISEFTGIDVTLFEIPRP
jgi:hypothetical protein